MAREATSRWELEMAHLTYLRNLITIIWQEKRRRLIRSVMALFHYVMVSRWGGYPVGS